AGRNLRRRRPQDRRAAPTRLVDPPDIAEDEPAGRVSIQVLELKAAPGRFPRVIGVEKADVLASREADPGVAGRRESTVLLPEGADPVAVRGQDPRRLVRRSVIDDDHLDGFIPLGQRAIDRLPDEECAVPSGDDRGEPYQAITRTDFRCGSPSRVLPCLSSGQVYLLSLMNSSSVTILRPGRGWRPIDPGEIWRYRELLWMLAIRDIKVRYKQTVLGAAWAILQPVLTMGVFSIVFGRLAKIPSDGAPYPLFCLAALLPWQLFPS